MVQIPDAAHLGGGVHTRRIRRGFDTGEVTVHALLPIRRRRQFNLRRHLSCVVVVLLSSGVLVGCASSSGATPKISYAKSAPSYAIPGPSSGCPSAACSSVLTSVADGAKESMLPAKLTPTLEAADSDLVAPQGGTCGSLGIPGLEANWEPCTWQSTTGSAAPKVVLLGESHAWQWSTSVSSIASSSGYSFGLLYHAACFISLTDLHLQVDDSTSDAADSPSGCHTWLEAAIKWINRYNPQVVIVAAQPSWGNDEATFLRGLTEVFEALKAPGRRFALIGGVPKLGDGDVGAFCLAAHQSNVQNCGAPYQKAVDVTGIEDEISLASHVGAEYINDIPWLCTTKICPAVIGNYEVYEDQAHITSTYADYLTPVLKAALHPVGL
jgi:hypothetical protein